MTQLQSMTGFASGQGEFGDFNWTWEMRGVNSKGLDVRLRVPDWIDGLEAALRKEISARIGRGNVTLNLRLSRRDGEGKLQLNTQQLDVVLTAMAGIEQQAMDAGISLAPSTAAEIVGLRGLLETQEPEADAKALKASILEGFQTIIASFCTMRGNEGTALQAVLMTHLDEVSELVSRAEEAAEARRPKAREAFVAALKKITETGEDVDEQRIAQELAILSVKSDITEEIKRLHAHINAARALTTEGGTVGRKLDFLMQEFNREANTLCSKSGDSDLTAIGLDLKAVIDQMREQVQNVE